MVAVQRGHTAAAGALLAAGADAWCQDIRGHTALHAAVWQVCTPTCLCVKPEPGGATMSCAPFARAQTRKPFVCCTAGMLWAPPAVVRSASTASGLDHTLPA